MKNSTEGMSDREALLWVLQQPEGTEFECQKQSTWFPLTDQSLQSISQMVEVGYTFRIAAPKPAAPERAWVYPHFSGAGRIRGWLATTCEGNGRSTAGALPYVPEATVPAGREAWVAPASGLALPGAWIETSQSTPRARRVLFIDETGQGDRP